MAGRIKGVAFGERDRGVAKPQPEEGTTRIANELFTAIVTAPFSKRELKVVLGWIRVAYGWRKTEASPSKTFLAQYTGMDLAHVGRTITALSRRNVFQEKSGAISLNKNYEEWRFEGTVLSRKAVAELDKSSGQSEVAKTATKKKRSGCQNGKLQDGEVAKTASKTCQNGNLNLPNRQAKLAKTASCAPEKASAPEDSSSLKKESNIKTKDKTTSSSSNEESPPTGKELVELFGNHYSAEYGSHYDWRKAEFIQANQLVKKHGYGECLRRMQNAFQYEYWFGELRTFGGVVKHFNELVSPPKERSRRARLRRPSTEWQEKGGRREI